MPSMAGLASLRAQALELEPESRATLVDVLLDSLDLGDGAATRQAWLDEVKSRRQTVAPGTVELLPGDEILAALE